MKDALPLPPPGFDELEVEQQIDYVQALWDRIAAKESAVALPEWHREVLDERLGDLATDPDASRSWEVESARLTFVTLRTLPDFRH